MDKTRDRMLAAVLLLALFASVGCDAGRDPSAQFHAGRESLMRGQFATAIESLDGYLAEHPHGELASRASFLMAKAYIGLNEIDNARSQFERTIRDYPDTNEAHKSQYKLAFLSLLEGDDDDARERFARIADSPAGTLVPEAMAMIRYLDARAQRPVGGEN